MKHIIGLFSYISIIAVIYLAVINYGDISSMHILTGNVSKTVSIHFSYFIILFFILGCVSGAMSIGQLYLVQKERLNAYKRELEKGSITNSSSTSKISILENKIRVLEKALNDALNK